MSLLIVRKQRLSRNQVLNCHKSLGSLFEGALKVFVIVIVIVIVIVFVFVFVFVFVIVFLLVRTYLLITLIKCLKDHKSLGSLLEGAL